jgi:hypothetical protein
MARADHARAGLNVRCAIYTRKSSDEGLDQEFNSLDAQREACEAYIVSQRHSGWIALSDILAKRMNATTVELNAGHLSLVSHPKEIADLILAASRRRE